MTTIAKDVAAKFAVAFVAAAMIFTAFAPAASAQEQSVEDLQALINSLMAQINDLEGDMGGDSMTSSSAVCPYTWTRDLSQGSTGADVMKLQQFLNETPDLRVAAAGAGSPGMETDYYGPATAAAVSKMQVMFRAEVLTPGGLVNPTGYFGPSSRAKANSLCVAAPVMDDEDEDEMEDEDESEDEEDNGPTTLRGEGTLDTFEWDDEETDLEENDEDVAIAQATIEADDGDIEIARMTFAVTNATGGGNTEDAWDVFETFSLWVDGDMIAEMDASDEDEYLDEDEGTFRFTDLDLFVEEGEEVEVLLGVSLQNNVDDLPESFDFTAEEVRYFDADGVATTEDELGDLSGNTTSVADAVNVDIEEEGADEELKLSTASSNPDSTDIIVDTDNDTNDVTILVADLEAEESDIELNRVIVRVDTTGASTTDVVDEVRVVIDGEEFDAEAITGTTGVGPTSDQSALVSAAGEAVWYVFDIDGDVVIDEDDEVQMEVVVDFKDTDDGNRYSNGQTIQARITGTEFDLWEAEGADDLVAADGQFDGTANGDSHTLVAEGILVPVDGFTADEETLGDNDDIGEFTLEFEVTAVEGDFYITDLATTTDQNNGVRYAVANAGDATINGILTSTADEDTPSVFIVEEGETETFTLTVTVSGQSAVITPRVTLTEINYTDETDGVVDGGASVIEGTYLPAPASDFRTGVQTIQVSA